MTARIYTFPDKYTKLLNGYKIPLYTEEEVFITISSMNTFGYFEENLGLFWFVSVCYETDMFVSVVWI